MLNFIKLYKVELIALFFLVALYFVLRLPNLTLQPIFADEAIYVRWAQVMKAEPTLRFLPVTDGKTPLFMWAMIPLFKLFEDPLYAGRFLSVMSGALTLAGTFFLGWRLFGFKAGVWAGFLVTITPFMVFFDRMALVDSMLAAFSIWALNFSLLLVKHLRVDLAMFLGYLLGGGLLIKTPAMFNLLALPCSILAANFVSSGRQKRLIKILGLWVIAVGIALIMYNSLRLGPEFDKLSSRNQDYVFSPGELVGRPLDPFIPHFYDIKEFWEKLLGTVISAIVLMGIFWVVIKKERYGLVVLLWSIIPLLIEMTFLKTFTARYILSSIPPLLCLGGLAVWKMEGYIGFKLKFSSVLVTLIMLIVLIPYPLVFNYTLLTRPTEANLPKNDRSGYFEEWTAGYGFPEIAQYLIASAKESKVVVGTDGFFGTLPDGLQIYLERYIHSTSKDRQIVVLGGNGLVQDALRESATKYPTFFVVNKVRLNGIPENTRLIKEYPKAKNDKGIQDAILFFQILPEQNNP